MGKAAAKLTLKVPVRKKKALAKRRRSKFSKTSSTRIFEIVRSVTSRRAVTSSEPPTPGQIAAREARKAASRLTPEQEHEHLRSALATIYAPAEARA